MRETINYYYNLNPNKIKKLFDYYYFYLDNELYYFVVYDRKFEDVNAIFDFNRKMLERDVYVNEIIDNKNKTVITYVNSMPYILMKVSVNINKVISLGEIYFLSSLRINYQNNLMRSNWAVLWADKIDYLEYHLEHNYQKFPLLANSFDYFVGLSENAISYLNYAISNMNPENEDVGVISHNSIGVDDTVYSLYNPLNIIIDHKARDLGEYIKLAFFRDNFFIFEELDEYFKYNYFSLYGVNLLVARILYPSFYFDKYDEIINGKEQENTILKITSRINEYEKYLVDVFSYLKKYYDIKEIIWLKKRGVNFR